MPRDRALEILADLIAFPTISSQTNLALINYVRALLARAGVESALIFNTERSKANLFATIGPKDAAGVLLSGHTDVVPVAGQAWSADPFQLRQSDGNLFGRGTADMKGFIACVLAVAERLDASRLRRPYQMVFSYDEEVGCVGVRSVLEDFASLSVLPDICIVGEPTSMRPAIAHKGKIAGRITCLGHECHSSQALDGLNAIHLATDMVAAIRETQSHVLAGRVKDDGFPDPYSTLHVGVIHGGTALNIVPRECRLDFEIRNIPSQNADDLLQALFDRAQSLTRVARRRFPEAGVSIEIINRYPGLLTPSSSPAVLRVQRLAGDHSAGKLSFGTEGGLIHERLGVPTLVCGPGDILQAHRPDEFVAKVQIASCLTFLTRLTDELATN
jgi:acetylornithine deacetylase